MITNNFNTTDVKLDMENFHIFELQLHNIMMLYRDAGEEIIKMEKADLNKIKPKEDNYTGKNRQQFIKRIVIGG